MLLNYGVGEDFWESLDSKEIKPVNPKGNRCWIFIGRTDAETLILWPPDAKNQLIGKDPDTGKDWRQDEKGTTEDETVGWHHWFNGHELRQTLGDGKDRTWCAAIRVVVKSQTWLGNWTTATGEREKEASMLERGRKIISVHRRHALVCRKSWRVHTETCQYW